MDYNMSVIYTSSVGIEHVSNLLIVNGIGGFEVCDSRDFEEFMKTRIPAYDYVDDKLLTLSSQRSAIKFYTAKNSQGDEIIRSVENSLKRLKKADVNGEYGTLEMSVSTVSDNDWKDNWKQFYRPIEIGGKLIVTPAWENVETDLPIIKIDPGMAFGTGSHETTALCLELLSELELSGKRVIDIGCGSGILALAAARLGAGETEGCDIDAAAVAAARANAQINSLEDKAAFVCGDLIELARGRYDIAVANIVADVIKTLSDSVGGILKENGIFICSGIIDSRKDEVIRHIESRGFEITKIGERRGWVAISAVKK